MPPGRFASTSTVVSTMPDNRDLDRVYLAIGKFQVYWSMYEYEMYRLNKIIYVNYPRNSLPKKFPDGIADKIALLERILKEESKLSGIATEGLKLTKTLWQHLELRHLIVHGSFFCITPPSTLTFSKPPQIADGPLKRAKQIEVELSQIEMAAQEMEDLSIDLGGFETEFQETLPNPPGSHP